MESLLLDLPKAWHVAKRVLLFLSHRYIIPSFSIGNPEKRALPLFIPAITYKLNIIQRLYSDSRGRGDERHSIPAHYVHSRRNKRRNNIVTFFYLYSTWNWTVSRFRFTIFFYHWCFSTHSDDKVWLRILPRVR